MVFPLHGTGITGYPYAKNKNKKLDLKFIPFSKANFMLIVKIKTREVFRSKHRRIKHSLSR